MLPLIPGIKKITAFVLVVTISFAFFNAGCGVYRFNDVSIPDSIRSIRINFIENRAPYVNPQLSASLTDRVKQKIINQTKLTSTNNENAHWVLDGSITDYSVSTSGISNKESVMNRLTVSVNIVLNKTLSNDKEEFLITRSFEFNANSSLQAAEGRLLDEMVRTLTDDIFNRLFSNW
ncbi:MAG: LPS assembly lipoprotein LptE [Chitinophagaceae bacterium]|jgi:hypothetical protein|nr:hypothetical protein [Flavisolibacter sp.]